MSSSSRKMLQAAAGSAGGGEFYPYTIDNSVRFDGASYLARTFTTPTDGKKYTVSSWLKLTDLAQTLPVIMSAVVSAGYSEEYIATYLNALRIYNGTGSPYLTDTAVRRDPSSWYHFHLKVDTTQATASDRMVMTVNGQAITVASSSYPALNSTQYMNAAVAHRIGYFVSIAGDYYFDGYMSDFVFIDGTAYDATDFGEDKNGVWVPKDPSGLTFGTNGFWLDFADSSNLGNDVSGNNNDFTVSGLTSSDQMIDTPTNNFATINPLINDLSNITLSEGNLKSVKATASNSPTNVSTIGMTSGKWYAETYWSAFGNGGGYSVYYYNGVNTCEGFGYNSSNGRNWVGWTVNTDNASFYGELVKVENGSATVSTLGSNQAAGVIIGTALDLDAGTVTFYANGVSQGSTSLPTPDSSQAWFFFTIYDGGNNSATNYWNFGQDSSFAGNKTRQNNTDENGIGDFYYSPPSGYLALCTANLPEPTLGPNSAENVTDYFAPVLYTGNGTAIGSGGKAVTGVGFQPDMVWIKNRDAADNHMLFDAVRGVTKYLSANSTNAEATDTESLSTFDTDGFTLGNNVAVNTSTEDYVAWNWNANGSGVSNTDGSITSTVSANQDAGFSIVSCTAPASGDFTVGHGLGQVPRLIIAKDREQAGTNFLTWFGDWTNVRDYLVLNDTAAKTTQPTTNVWGSAVPTSTVFGMTAGSIMVGGNDTIAWCFAEVEGFSKFGSYTGNGSADGPFIYTGFRPAFILVKVTSTTSSWVLYDTARDSYNVASKYLLPDTSGAEGTNSLFDINSNGFKCRGNPTSTNGSGQTYIYMAFAEMPFKYSVGR